VPNSVRHLGDARTAWEETAVGRSSEKTVMVSLLLGIALASAPLGDSPRAAVGFKLQELRPPLLALEAKRLSSPPTPATAISASRLALRLEPCARWGKEVLEHSEVVAAGVDIPLHQKVNLLLETTRGIRNFTYWDARAVIRLAFPDVL